MTKVILTLVVVSIATCLRVIVPVGRAEGLLGKGRVPVQQGMRSITVADTIQMTQLGDPDYLGGVSAKRNPALFSPDGMHFVIVIKRGNIEKNTNDYSLLLFQNNNATRSPAPEVLASFSSSSNRPGVQDVKWIGNRTLAFLGENPGEQQQVYEVDCETRRLTKLTHHSTSVISYAMNTNGDEIFFAAQRPVQPLFERRAERDWMVVSSQPLTDLLTGEAQWDSGVFADLFVTRKNGQQESPVLTPRGSLTGGGLWLSPNSRYLIATALVGDIPDIWKGYGDRSVQWQARVQAKPLHGDSPLVPQYELIDLEAGKSKPLLEAPTGDGCSEALWLPDSNSVVVSGVYLPLDVADRAERGLRQSTTMIAEIRMPSLEIVPVRASEQCRLRWEARSETLLIGATTKSASSDSAGDLVGFQKTGAGWKEVGLPKSDRDQNDAIDVTLEEDMNTPPKVLVQDLQTGKKSVLLDLNPQFEGLKFARVQSISFKATDGHQVKAGVYLPPDYTEGKRYPLVIQTHAWNSERFWIDGPWPSAFAAQPLAGKGIVVLQLSEDISTLSTPEEVPEEVSAYEGGIDYLDSLGIIDRRHVGIIGFSRTGLGVEYALTHSKYRFAAVTMADFSDGGYFSYVSILPSFSWRWPDYENINGGSPFGSGMTGWLKNSPDFNLTTVRTPVREEAYQPFGLLSAWEWFAGLSRLGKPVELIYIPDATHVLVRPRDRIISQGGNVDWFRFWLQDYEDPDPAKAEQYARWRELLKLQEHSQNAAPTN